MNDEERNQWDQASHANYIRRNRFLSENITLPESGLCHCFGTSLYYVGSVLLAKDVKMSQECF